MNYFERDYESSRARVEELFLAVMNQLQRQNSMIEELFTKVDFLTKLSEKYESNNRENAVELIELLTNCNKNKDIDTLKEICDYIKVEMDCVKDDTVILNSRVETQEIGLNKLEDYAEMHWGYHRY